LENGIIRAEKRRLENKMTGRRATPNQKIISSWLSFWLSLSSLPYYHRTYSAC